MEEVIRPKGVRPIHLVLIAIVAAINTIASIAATVIQPFPGKAFIYLPVAVMPVFGIWFGPWALIGGILSGVLYAPFWGMPIHFGFISGFSDAYLGLIPWIAFKALKINPELKTIKDYLAYFIFIVGITVTSEQLVYSAMSAYIFGFFPPSMIIAVTVAAIPGALIGTFPLSLILLKALSGFVKKTPLYVKGWIF
ncbi:MAG: hypothetical protein QW589_08370 [Candidatus Bathyarchaeia archaeon]